MKYLEMNIAAEERECIVAEAREKLCLHEFTEQQDKAIGSSSLREILSNLNQYGKKNELLQVRKILIKYFNMWETVIETFVNIWMHYKSR